MEKKHSLNEFENITDEILKTEPLSIQEITKETIKVVEDDLKEKEGRDIEDQEIEL